MRNSDELAKRILESIGKEGQITRKYYQRRLPSDPSKDYYFIQRLTGNTQPVLIEYGFIDNANDLKKLQNNIIKYGEAVVRAVASYTNTPYKAPTSLETNVYTVQKGDTLYSIANKFNITVPEIKASNNLTSNLLTLGQELIIPSVQQSPQPNEYVIYTVQKGDTLYNIAKEYNVTVNDLINYNQLSTLSLSIGQKLLIPSKENNSTQKITDFYTVQNGDSLYSIAKKFNTSVDEIIRVNNLTSTILQLGQKLVIPNYTNIDENISDFISDTDNPDNTTMYTVSSGDSLYSIAKKYNISVDAIKDLNGLTSNLLSVGQQLILPVVSDNKTYYVQAGDSLYSIARKYETTVDEIKKLNSLENNSLSIGQVLLIP